MQGFVHAPRKRFAAPLAVLLALAGCGGGSSGSITTPPPTTPPPSGNLALERAFPNLSFTAPLAVMQAPGDSTHWYVVQQSGVIRRFDADDAVAASTVFADISDRADDSESESGLLGMAFHPQFATNGEVYLSYTRTGAPLESVISRFTIDAADQTLDESSEQVLLTLPQSRTNHNGGNLAFGPDGFLYAGFGDGGGSGDPDDNGQNTHNLYGTIIRINVDNTATYTIPAGNPFSSNTPCNTGGGTEDCPEIFAFGFRNPWRFSFDRQTGELWVGDVGQGTWEEVDRVTSGMNYGWRQREGAHCFNPASGCSTANVDPITEYDHSVGNSITGGYVYRGSTLTSLAGQYLFGDFGSGRLFTVAASSMQGVAPVERLDSSVNISSFGQANDGELYVVDYGGGIYRVVAGT